MKKIDLDEKYVDFIRDTILSVDSELQIYIFGSRAQNKAQEYSDVDVALKSDGKIAIEKILKLKNLFQESTLPYKLDIIDLNSIEEYFYEIVKDDLIRIN